MRHVSVAGELQAPFPEACFVRHQVREQGDRNGRAMLRCRPLPPSELGLDFAVDGGAAKFICT
jgi:hypothetical protein